MEPVELTEDGWFKTYDNVDIEKAIPCPIKIQTTDNRYVKLNEFRVGLEWKFYKSYEPERITVKDKKLTFKAKGTDLRTSPPILFVAGQHAYEVETRIEIEGDVTAGIVLYYNDRFFMGTGFNKESAYVIAKEKNAAVETINTPSPVYGYAYATTATSSQEHIVMMA